VLKGTKLAELYESGKDQPLEQEEYIRLVADALELLPPETVICRLTGDGKAEDLLAPMWSRQKLAVINGIDRLLYQRNSCQGIRYTSIQDVSES
jgi:radical SAM superfamily enzyme